MQSTNVCRLTDSIIEELTNQKWEGGGAALVRPAADTLNAGLGFLRFSYKPKNLFRIWMHPTLLANP